MLHNLRCGIGFSVVGWLLLLLFHLMLIMKVSEYLDVIEEDESAQEF